MNDMNLKYDNICNDNNMHTILLNIYDLYIIYYICTRLLLLLLLRFIII